MLTINKSLNIISLILIFIIFYSILNNTIYFKKYENFETRVYDDIYIKCPRGCDDDNERLPPCSLCGPSAPDYAEASSAQKEAINAYHLAGDQAKRDALDKIADWKKKNKDARFRFIFLHDNTLHSVNIHPDYQITLYEIYQKGKDSSNIYQVTKWMEQLQLQLNDYSHLQQIDEPSNWTFITITPSQWVKDVIYDIVMTKDLGSYQYYNELTATELQKYSIVPVNPTDFSTESGSEYSEFSEKRRNGLTKIFDACDIDGDEELSNGEEIRYLLMAMTYMPRRKEDEEVRKLGESFKIENSDTLSSTVIWDKIYLEIKDKEWVRKDKFIETMSAKPEITILILKDAIHYLEQSNLLDITHDIISIVEEKDVTGEHMMKREEIRLSDFIIKLERMDELLNEKEESIAWDSQYTDVSERELTVEEEKEREEKEERERESLKWKKYNITDDDEDMNSISEKRMLQNGEYLKNIAKPIGISHELALDRWGKYTEGTTNEHSKEIITNIREGRGLHIDDIAWIFQFERSVGLEYLNDLIEELEELDEEVIKTEDKYEINIKASCMKDHDNLFTEIKIANNLDDGLISKEQCFWPIFSRDGGSDINENILLDKTENECASNTMCSELLNNGTECMFLSKKARIKFNDKEEGEYW
tara:strand:- start:6817 stop:8760 length:1944 start_codon:yes stop_codon:yes gene_type:complete